MTTLPPPRRADWRDLVLYQLPETPVAVDLSDNTSRFGVPPAALAVLRDPDPESIARYPSGYGEPLKQALAAYAGVTPGQVVTGCGSDDVLDSAVRACARPGDLVATLAPTFPMPARFARLNGQSVSATPVEPDGTFDPSALLAGDPAIVYLCSPNNPTGARLDPGAVDHVLAHAPGVVIVDEAYAEFCGETRAAAAPALGRVLVVRTLSKAFALAGLRVGWATGHEALVRDVELSRGPYTVNALAERAAIAAVTHDAGWVRERAAEAVAARERLADGLRALGLAPLPSATNFVFVPVADAPAVAARARTLGLGVRALPATPRYGDALRMHAAPAAEQDRALAILKEALACA
ncbi:MAG: histidinol-phosphate transaminase [Candidatus Eisenbacteria bacterium]